MLVKVNEIIRICFFVLILQNMCSFAHAMDETNKAYRSTLFDAVYKTLHCRVKPCDMEKIKLLYETILKIDQTTYSHIGYANVLKKLAKTEKELLEAQDMDTQAAYKDFFSCVLPDNIMSLKAKLLSGLYRIGIFFPPDLKNSKKWANIAQYYKEKHLYK